MTTETKASTTKDVEKHYVEVLEAIAAGPHSPGCDACKGACQCHVQEAMDAAHALRNLALLGVQVPGLREVGERAEDRGRGWMVQAEDLTGDVSTLQARVAELEDDLGEANDWRHLHEAEKAARKETMAERDTLRAQIELLRKASAECLDWLDCDPRDEDLAARARLRAALSTPTDEENESEDDGPCCDRARNIWACRIHDNDD